VAGQLRTFWGFNEEIVARVMAASTIAGFRHWATKPTRRWLILSDQRVQHCRRREMAVLVRLELLAAVDQMGGRRRRVRSPTSRTPAQTTLQIWRERPPEQLTMLQRFDYWSENLDTASLHHRVQPRFAAG
jgi:hypothetical protein